MKYVPKVLIFLEPAAKTNLTRGSGIFPITTSLGEALKRVLPDIGDVRVVFKGMQLDQTQSLEALGLQNDDVLTLTY